MRRPGQPVAAGGAGDAAGDAMQRKLCKHLCHQRPWQLPYVRDLRGAHPRAFGIVFLRQIAGGRDGLLREFSDLEHGDAVLRCTRCDSGQGMFFCFANIRAADATINAAFDLVA